MVHAEDLQLIAASCPALQELHFQDAIILSTDVPSIITFICGLHALKVLSLMMPVEYTLTVKETSMLATQLAQLTSVSIFNLESTNALEFFHCFLSQYPCLRHLDLCHISYDIEGETRLSSLYVGDEIILESDYHINLIVNILRNLPRLDKLLWSNWNDLYGNTTLISAFSSSCTEVLRNVSHCELALESAEQLPTLSILLSMLPNLIDLEISSFQDESETEVFTVACCRTLAEHSPRVRRLLLYLDRDLACGGFSEASMQVLLDGLQDLCSFELLVRCNELIALQSLAVLATSDRVWDYLDFTYTPLKMEDVCISIDQDGLHVKRLGFNHPSMYVGYGHIPITSAQVLNAVSRREVAFSNAIPRKYAAM
ncbi:hypothetical protein EON65_22040 [archaeon]|nr:MAG: hypothetical protein EON65_22040 [archaeon]